MEGVLNLRQLQPLAKAALTARGARAAFDYVAGGANDEATLGDNERAFARWLLVPRLLVDVSSVDTSVPLFGSRLATPLLVAPMAMHRLMHPDGELATVRAACALGVGFVLSTLSSVPLEAVAAAHAAAHAAGPAPGAPPPPLWLQLYVLRDRAATAALVLRAAAAGYTAVVLTADAPRLGRREADTANGFAPPRGVTAANLEGLPGARLDSAPGGVRGDGSGGGNGGASTSSATASSASGPTADPTVGPTVGPTPRSGSSLFAWFGHQVDPSLGWDVVPWLRALSPLPVIVKGVLGAPDAARAAAAGAAAVAVSNHGGRQLDGAPAAVDALADIAAAAAAAAAAATSSPAPAGPPGLPLLVDGGVRRGGDVLKALALGASAVLVGRPVLWALALGGEGGVRKALGLLLDELRLAQALAGCPKLPPPRGAVARRAAL